MAKFDIKNLSIRLKIIILSLIVVFYALSLVFFIGTFQQKLSSNKTYLTKTYLLKNNLLNNSQRIINSFIVLNHISYEKKDDFMDIQNSFFQTNDSIIQITKKHKSITTTIDENIIIDNFLVEYQIFQNIIYEIFNEYKKEEINLKNISRLFNRELLTYQNLTILLKDLKLNNNKNFVSNINSIENDISKLIVQTLLCFIIFILIFIFLTIFFFRDTLNLPFLLEPHLNKLSAGELLDKKLISNKNNASIIKSIRKISTNYERINNFINELKNKNYEFELDNLGKNDFISTSIIELRTQLVSSQKDLEHRQKEDKQKEWANTGINKFSEIMKLTILWYYTKSSNY